MMPKISQGSPYTETMTEGMARLEETVDNLTEQLANGKLTFEDHN